METGGGYWDVRKVTMPRIIAPNNMRQVNPCSLSDKSKVFDAVV
jgi:hypothetical protein